LLTDAEMKRWERTMWNGKYSSEEIEDKLNDMFEGTLRFLLLGEELC
jgi:hypothetical protein